MIILWSPWNCESKQILLPLIFYVTYFEYHDEKLANVPGEALGNWLHNMGIEACVLHSFYLDLIWHLQIDELYVLKSYFHSPTLSLDYQIIYPLTFLCGFCPGNYLPFCCLHGQLGTQKRADSWVVLGVLSLIPVTDRVATGSSSQRTVPWYCWEIHLCPKHRSGRK